MKLIKTLEDLKEHIFSNKERASKRHLNDSNAEKPRELFNRTCEIIANSLISEGFKYFPSQHKLKLDSIDKQYSLQIKFSSNRDNVAGQYVELSPVFYIESKKLKKFSKENPVVDYWNENIIGRNFSSLMTNKGGNVIWNLAQKKDFESAISIIPELVKKQLIGVFKQSQNTEYLCKEINDGNFELGNIASTVQYLLMLGKTKVAENYVSNFLLREKGKYIKDYLKEKKQLADNGMPNYYVHGMGFGHEISLIEKTFELKITVPNSV